MRETRAVGDEMPPTTSGVAFGEAKEVRVGLRPDCDTLSVVGLA